MDFIFKTQKDLDEKTTQLMYIEGKDGMKINLYSNAELAHKIISLAHNLNGVKQFEYKNIDYNGDKD